MRHALHHLAARIDVSEPALNPSGRIALLESNAGARENAHDPLLGAERSALRERAQAANHERLRRLDQQSFAPSQLDLCSNDLAFVHSDCVTARSSQRAQGMLAADAFGCRMEPILPSK
jgi:hypothetical protein